MEKIDVEQMVWDARMKIQGEAQKRLDARKKLYDALKFHLGDYASKEIEPTADADGEFYITAENRVLKIVCGIDTYELYQTKKADGRWSGGQQREAANTVCQNIANWVAKTLEEPENDSDEEVANVVDLSKLND